MSNTTRDANAGLLESAKVALNEMCFTSAPRNSFTDAVDALDAAITKAQAAQSQPAPPVPQTVQEIMRLMNVWVSACIELDRRPVRAFADAQREKCEEAFKLLQAALTALVDDNHRLQFELDGVRAMRGPLTEAELTAIHSLPYVRACLMEYRHWPVDETASAVVKAIAVQISALAASPYTNGIEPEQGGKP